MNEADYLALLRSVDDPIHAEFPQGFDWRDAVRRFNSLVALLEQRLGCRLEVERDIQDASHHGAAYLPAALLTEEYATSVLASNFGNLATVWDEESVVLPQHLAVIRASLAEQGYLYVPSAILHLPYTGINSGILQDGAILWERGASWGYRYFSYL